MDITDFVSITIAVVLGGLAVWFAYPAFRRERVEREIMRFVAERKSLVRNRPGLVLEAARGYAAHSLIEGTPCLAVDEWILKRPLLIDEVTVRFSPTRRTGGITGGSNRAQRIIPRTFVREDPKCRYSDALEKIPAIRPSLFWDGPSYDLRSFEQHADGSVNIDLGLASYFDMLSLSEALAHEFSLGRRLERTRSGSRLVIRSTSQGTLMSQRSLGCC